MAAQTFDALLNTVNMREHVLSFLELTGWEHVEPDNPHWSIWHGALDGDGRPFELVFPNDGSARERRAYLLTAVEALAALHGEDEGRIIQRIVNYDRDMLFLRNLETNLDATLPLDRAMQQVAGLHKVFLYAASAEIQPRPFTRNTPPRAAELAHNCSFGHTLPGSFVFMVTTPRLPRAEELPPVQLHLAHGEDRAAMQVFVQQETRPFERRVSERIARGLSLSRQARTRDYTILLDEYGKGFNANLCDAIVEVAAEGDAEIELQIAWSPRLPPAEDVATLPAVQVSRADCSILEHVAERLRETTPDPVTIRGNIRGLLTTGNPDSPAARRTVIVQGHNPQTGRQASFVVELSREDYRKALESHGTWKRVAVTGIPTLSADGWRLANPEDFEIIG